MDRPADTPARDPSDFEYDLFVSHASEDKAAFVAPLADRLRRLGLRVWYDGFALAVGDSLSRSIDRGLARSRFGVVVLSPSFLEKGWPEYELRGLTVREVGGEKVVLPIWHGVTKADVISYSPPLADKVAIDTGSRSVEEIAEELFQAVRPDLALDRHRLAAWRAALGPRVNVPFDRVIDGPILHTHLPRSFRVRCRLVHEATAEVSGMGLDDLLDGFYRDVTPESELQIWEGVAATYLAVTRDRSINRRGRQHVYGVLLGLTMYPAHERHTAWWGRDLPRLTERAHEAFCEIAPSDMPRPLGGTLMDEGSRTRRNRSEGFGPD